MHGKPETDITRPCLCRRLGPRWLAGVGLLLVECQCSSKPPSIELTQVPETGPGDAARMQKIAGRALGAKPGQRIVLYAKSGTWWLQPLFNKPFTPIGRDSTWTNATHTGTEYAALLVESKYIPRPTTDALPAP